MKGKIIISIIATLLLFTNISVYADDLDITEETSSPITKEELSENSKTEKKEPTINARHAIVLDRNSLQTLYGKKETEKCKMASTTKIMTSILVIEKTKDLNETTTISKRSAGTRGSRLGLTANDKVTINSLLYGLMLCSGNDAAVALAEYIGGSVENFANIMNEKAQELNLSNTHFVTPHGLDNDDHYTTAYDLAILTNYCLKNETFAKIVKTQNATVTINNNPKNINNTNELLGKLEGIYGVKTGFTNGANRCLVTACKRGNLDIICIVLGCDAKKNRTQDSIKLINYTFNNFTMIDVENIINTDFNNWKQNNTKFFIEKGISNSVNYEIDSKTIPYKKLAIKKEEFNQLKTIISCDTYFKAPLLQNQTIGNLTLSTPNKKYFSCNIIVSTPIYKKRFNNYILDFLKILSAPNFI